MKASIRRKGKAPEDLRGLHIDIQPDGEVWTSARTKEPDDIHDIMQAFVRFIWDNDLTDELEEGVKRHLETKQIDIGGEITFELDEESSKRFREIIKEAIEEDDEEEDAHEYMA